MEKNKEKAVNEVNEAEIRAKLFDRDFQDLQRKYKFKAIAQVIFPGGAQLNVPITLIDTSAFPETITTT